VDDNSGENELCAEDDETNELGPNDGQVANTSESLYDEIEKKSRILEDSLRNRKKTEESIIAPIKDIKQCLTVSKKIILFGAVIPGQIKEQRLLIENFSSEL